MLCGLPIILSDEILGRREQIDEGETGYIFPCGNVDALAKILRHSLADPSRLAAMGQAARRKMDGISPATNVRDFVHLLDATFPGRPRKGDQ
jgi:glycosyltransferase involved in cell wall biosynthesis